MARRLWLSFDVSLLMRTPTRRPAKDKPSAMTTAFDSLPAASASVSAASASVPAASESVPVASASVSTASGSVSAASPSVSAASDSVSVASLHPFLLSAECASTADGFSEQSFPMRADLFETPAVSFGFHATSRHCIPRLSPQNSNRNAITANNGAAANRSGRHACCSAAAATTSSSRAARSGS